MRFVNVIRSLIMAVAIISVSVTAVLSCKPLYYLAVDLFNISENSGYSEDEIRLNYDALIDYNKIGGSERLEFPTLPSSEEGLIHFAEVKDIFISIQIAAMVSAALLVIIAAREKFRKRKFSKRKSEDLRHERYGGEFSAYSWLKYGAITACLLPAVVMTAAALWWDRAFVIFHEIMFDNDYWIFDSDTDPIITMLPDEFFFMCCMAIGVMILLLSGGAYLAYRRLRRRKEC